MKNAEILANAEDCKLFSSKFNVCLLSYYSEMQ